MMICPFCQNSVPNVGILASHIMKDHGEELTQVLMNIFSTLGEVRYGEVESPGP